MNFITKKNPSILLDNKESLDSDNDLNIYENLEQKDELNALEQNIKQELQNIIYECLQQLPIIQKQIILLKIYEDYQFKQIGEILEMNYLTVTKYYYRGLKKLNELLKQKDKRFAGIFVSILSIKDTIKYRDVKIDENFDKSLQTALNNQSMLNNDFKSSSLTNLTFNNMQNVNKFLVALVGILGMVAILALGLVGYLLINKDDKKDINKDQKAEITTITQTSTQTQTLTQVGTQVPSVSVTTTPKPTTVVTDGYITGSSYYEYNYYNGRGGGGLSNICAINISNKKKYCAKINFESKQATPESPLGYVKENYTIKVPAGSYYMYGEGYDDTGEIISSYYTDSKGVKRNIKVIAGQTIKINFI